MAPDQPDRLLTMSEVMRLMSVKSRTTIYRYLQENPDFPRPCKMGRDRGRLKFRATEVARLIGSLEARR